MATTTSTLPGDFLIKPAKDLTTERIDFKASLPEYAGLYAVIIDNALTPQECTQLIAAAEATTNGAWERAQVNIGGGRQMLLTDSRNCGRIIWDSRELVAKVWARIENLPDVQDITRLENVPRITGNGPGEVWRMTRCNERLRFLKYVGGEYFRPHCDGIYETPDRCERTYVTLHLYLNDHAKFAGPLPLLTEPKARSEAMRSRLQGGATTFHSLDMKDRVDVLPKAGRILLFQHRDLLHSGDDVTQGVKYTMRTDVLYAMESSKEAGRSKGPGALIEPTQTSKKNKKATITEAIKALITENFTRRFGV